MSIESLIQPNVIQDAALLFTVAIAVGAPKISLPFLRRNDGVSLREEVEEVFELSHINHDKSDPKKYNHPSNIERIPRRNHYDSHYKNHKYAMTHAIHGILPNGLTRADNIKAMVLIWDRMTPQEKKGRIAPQTKWKDDDWLDDVG